MGMWWMGVILAVAVMVAIAQPTLGADLGAGKAIFTKECQNCHGPDGKGNPEIEKVLKKKIADLTEINLSKLPKAEREQLQQKFRKGLADGAPPMPAFGKKLSKGDQENVLEYVQKTFMKGGR
ncbi:MAG: c-type cytochrome [Candidatus Rokubacteria bacterium]|nr:c-type cytochrome [Candidatus Rokubacteria bacterium]